MIRYLVTKASARRFFFTCFQFLLFFMYSQLDDENSHFLNFIFSIINFAMCNTWLLVAGLGHVPAELLIQLPHILSQAVLHPPNPETALKLLAAPTPHQMHRSLKLRRIYCFDFYCATYT